MIEIRYSLDEVRLSDDGRSITGVALRYGDTAKLPWARERVDPGAFGNLARADVILNSMHNRGIPLARTGGGGLELIDTSDSLSIRATLPKTTACDDTLALIRGRVLRGLSIEFRADKEAWSQSEKLRTIMKARLMAIGVVDIPAYKDSVIDQMRKRYEQRDAEPRRFTRVFW